MDKTTFLQGKSLQELEAIARNYQIDYRHKSEADLISEIVYYSHTTHFDTPITNSYPDEHSDWCYKASKVLERSPITHLSELTIPDNLAEMEQLISKGKNLGIELSNTLEQEMKYCRKWMNSMLHLYSGKDESVQLIDWAIDIQDTIQKVIQTEERDCFCASIGTKDHGSNMIDCPTCKVSYHRNCLKVTKTYELPGCPCCIIIPHYNPFKKPHLNEVRQKLFKIPLIRPPEAVLLANSLIQLQEWLDEIEYQMIERNDFPWQRMVLGKLYCLPVLVPLAETLENNLKQGPGNSEQSTWSRKRKSDELPDEPKPRKQTNLEIKEIKSDQEYPYQYEYPDRHYFYDYYSYEYPQYSYEYPEAYYQ